jgi:thiamine transport system substrate-binding protein
VHRPRGPPPPPPPPPPPGGPPPRPTRPIRRAALVAATVVAVLAAGPVTPVTAAPATTSGAAKTTETITLVTHDSFSVSDDVLAAFTRQTGIRVEILKAGDAGEALSQAILTEDDPLGDVFYGVDNTFLSRALDAGIFVPYASPELEHVPAEYRVDRRDRVTPIDRADVCLNVDRPWFSAHKVAVPDSLDDLTKPAYKGRLVVENPATSSPGLAFLLATIAKYGTRGWEAYWEDLRANDVRVVDGWSQAYYDEFTGGGTGTGDRPIVVSYASSPAAAVVYAEDPKPTTSPVVAVTADCFAQVEFAGILRGTEHRAAARKLIDFMLSKRFQEDMPLNMFVYPVRDDAELPEVFTENAEIPEEPLTLSPSRIAKRRAEWIDRWTEIALR